MEPLYDPWETSTGPCDTPNASEAQLPFQLDEGRILVLDSTAPPPDDFPVFQRN